jgi:hypothetical protein
MDALRSYVGLRPENLHQYTIEERISLSITFGRQPQNKLEEEFEDTKRVIRIRKSKNRQHNGQKKTDKKTNNDLQNIHIKLKSE